MTIRNRTRGQSTHPLRNTSLFLRLNVGTIRNRSRGQSMRPIRNTSLFLRLYAGPIRNITRGQSTSSIRNTSSLFRLHARTIHESNPEHLLVFKALCGDDPQEGGWTNERPGTYHVMSGPMRGLKINYMRRGHIYKRINRHCKSMTDPAQRAESVREKKSFLHFVSASMG